MLEFIVTFVAGGVCWEYRTKIIATATQLYNDIVVDDDDNEERPTSAPKKSKTQPESNRTKNDKEFEKF